MKPLVLVQCEEQMSVSVDIVDKCVMT